MIWDLIEQSQFDKHFSKPDLTITALLLDENIITELKNQNPKLLQYIAEHKQQFITELIEYTVVMPLQTDSYDRGHKLPYISSELLAIDSELIYGEFFRSDLPEEENPFWQQLLHFLETAAAQNEILMGYFEKVVTNLYNGSKPKVARVVAHHLERFARLLHNGSIGDILKKCIILLNTPQGVVLEQRQSIIKEVVHRFAGTDERVKEICADILAQVVNRFQAFSSGDALIQKLLNDQELHQIYWIQHSPAVNGFLVGLLKKSQQRIVNENGVSVRILTVPALHLENISNYLKKEVQNLAQLIASDSYIVNQNRVMVRKSNKKIYPILALASLAIEQNLTSFITSKFINSLWNLIILYPYNNIMQVSVLKIFASLLKTAPQEAKDIFLDRYEEYLLELVKNNLNMFRPLIFTIWKQANNYPTVTTDPVILGAFVSFKEEHLDPLLKYEINKNTIQHHQNHNKLIVDEEDKPAAPPSEFTAPTETQFVPHPQPVDDPQPPIEQPPSPPKESFDFFSGWQADQKNSKPKQPEKTSMFDDFSSFF